MPIFSNLDDISSDLEALVNSFWNESMEQSSTTTQLIISDETLSQVQIKFSEQEIITIHSNGTVELSRGLTKDKAARLFWEKISFYGGPMSVKAWQDECSRLKNEIVSKEATITHQKQTIKALQEKIDDLEFKGMPNLVKRFDLED